MRGLWKFILALGVAIGIGQGVESVRADDFDEDLKNLDKMYKLPDPPYAAIESHAKGLLARYTEPKQQGQVYRHLCLIYGSGGLRNDTEEKRCIECAKKALETVEDPMQRMRLYNYWASTVSGQGPQHRWTPENCKAAAEIILKGLKEARTYNLPGITPDWPNPPPMTDGMDSNPEARQRYAAAQAEYEKAAHVRQVCIRRDSFYEYLNQMCRFLRGGKTELRELATKILDDPAMVEATMDAVVNVRVPGDPLPPLPK